MPWKNNKAKMGRGERDLYCIQDVQGKPLWEDDIWEEARNHEKSCFKQG